MDTQFSGYWLWITFEIVHHPLKREMLGQSGRVSSARPWEQVNSGTWTAGLFSSMLKSACQHCLTPVWEPVASQEFGSSPASTSQTSNTLEVSLGFCGHHVHSPCGQSLCPPCPSLSGTNSSPSQSSAGVGPSLFLSLNLDLQSCLTQAFPS